MYTLLIYTIIGFFLALLFLNLYFRIKVFGIYKRLVKNRVNFEVKQLFNKTRLEEEVIPMHKAHAEDILAFANHIRTSVFLAILLIILIAIVGGILAYYQ